MEILKSLKKDYPEDRLLTGTMAFGSWERLLPQLKQFFAIKEGEEIVGIKITKEGITAKIEID
jgi:ABC-type sulfate transport system substrate-binding protein